MDENLLTISEVCELLHSSPSAIYSLRSRGVAPASLGVRVGRKLLWKRADIDAWFEAQKRAVTERAS